MISRCAFLLVPLLAFGQSVPAPPAVDKALRARVTAFYQNFVDGTPRKAEVFVAEDTKDLYYNQGKEHFLSFRIDKITYSDDFKKAAVIVVGTIEKVITGQRVVMEKPNDTRWKIENGEWCWYYHAEDYPLTPMGGARPPAPTGPVGATRPLDLSEEAIQRAGQAILAAQPMGIDLNSVVIDPREASTKQVVFTNGSDGYVQLELNGPIVRGLKFKFDKVMIPAHEKAVLTLHFDPTDQSGPPDAYTPKGTITVQVVTQPIQKMFPLSIVFSGK